MDATEAAVHFALALQRAQVPHAIGGAIAYGFFGAARGTFDVDLNVFVEGAQAPLALDALIAAGLEIDRSLALMRDKLDVAYVRRALVETVGETDYRCFGGTS